MTTPTFPFELGQSAFSAAIPLSRNPYRRGGPEARQWIAGWYHQRLQELTHEQPQD